MPQYLDQNGNPIPASPVYLDPNTGEPLPSQYGGDATAAPPAAQQPGMLDPRGGWSPGDFLRGAASGVKNMIAHPIDTIEGMGEAITAGGMAPGGMYPTTAATGRPADAQANTAVQQEAQQHQANAAHFIGQNPAYAIGGTVGPAAATAGAVKYGPAIASAAADAADFAGVEGLERAAAYRGNLTASQFKARAAVTAEGNAGSGGNFIPQDLARKTGPILRNTAAENPDLMDKINNGNPVEALKADIDMHEAAKARIDQAHNDVLRAFQNSPVDTQAIQRAIQPTRPQMQGMDPADLSAIRGLQARAQNVTTLGGLNEFRKFMNTEDTTLRGNPSYAKTVGYPDLVHNMANATRAAYYDALQNATGKDFTGIKQTEGDLIQQLGGLKSALPRLASAEAKATGPFQVRPFLGEVAQGTTRSGLPGLPVITKAAKFLAGTKLEEIQRNLQTFYSNPSKQPPVEIPQLAPNDFLPRANLPLGLPRGSIVTPAPAEGTMWEPTPSQNFVGPYGSGAFAPEMNSGERIAALMQLLRQKRQAALPAKATPIQLPSSFQ